MADMICLDCMHKLIVECMSSAGSVWYVKSVICSLVQSALCTLKYYIHWLWTLSTSKVSTRSSWWEPHIKTVITIILLKNSCQCSKDNIFVMLCYKIIVHTTTVLFPKKFFQRHAHAAENRVWIFIYHFVALIRCVHAYYHTSNSYECMTVSGEALQLHAVLKK